MPLQCFGFYNFCLFFKEKEKMRTRFIVDFFYDRIPENEIQALYPNVSATRNMYTVSSHIH